MLYVRAVPEGVALVWRGRGCGCIEGVCTVVGKVWWVWVRRSLLRLGGGKGPEGRLVVLSHGVGWGVVLCVLRALV